MSRTFTTTSSVNPRRSAFRDSLTTSIIVPVVEVDDEQGKFVVAEHIESADAPLDLRCNCPRYQMSRPNNASMCLHVRDVLVNQEDRPYQTWESIGAHSRGGNDGANILVSVFVDPKLVMQVLVQPAPDQVAAGTCRVAIVRPDQELIPLGFTSEQCSRWMLRRLITDYLIEHCTDIDLECHSDIHRKSKDFHVTDVADPKQLSDLASILISGWCLECIADWEVTRV